MRPPNKLYIVAWNSGDMLLIGFLPRRQAPKILRDAFFADEHCITMENGGFLGIYQNKKLAEAHLRAERKWRQEPLWIVTIDAKDSTPRYFRRPIERAKHEG